MTAEFRLLCVGDMHLGRRPTRIAEGVRDLGIRVEDLTPAAAWSATVDWAIANGVDAVALAGDVVESLEDRFEAYGHLERGVRRLTEQGIHVVGVAGNHDVHALPRLADRIEDFVLLGRGGKWQTVSLDSASGARVVLLGWSFPEREFRANPLDELTLDVPPGAPVVGLLHCDLDQTRSAYAPIPRRAFDSAPGNAWLLGHVHKPSDLCGRRPVGYLGSLVGLDPGEPGIHGPWLARISREGEVALEQQPLAPIRWESQTVSIDGVREVTSDSAADTLASLIDEGVRSLHERIAPMLGNARVVGCRVHLTGRSGGHRVLAAAGTELRGEVRDHDDVVYFLEKIIDDAGPAHDLEQLGEAKDPPGLLARRILLLQRGGPEADRLVQAAMAAIRDATGFVPSDLEDEVVAAVSPERTRELLLRAGMKALEELLAQREVSEGSRS